MSRDAAMLRKLQYDEGTGDDKKYQNILSFTKSLRSEGTVNAPDALKALRQLDGLEVFMRKQWLISKMCDRQTQEYEDMANKVDEEVSRSRDRMAAAKTELAAARIIRRNRQEYDLLARMIDEIPSRSETNRKLEEIRDELTQQQERQQQLEAKLSERRNHLHAFNIILANFQKFLNDEDEQMESGDGKIEGDDRETESKEGSAAPEELQT